MLTRAFTGCLFEGFSILRWNDKLRPVEVPEMDRAAFKMMTAYFLGKQAEEQGEAVDWSIIIYGGLFDLLKKIHLSDIKATVHRRIRDQYPEELHKLNEWVLRQCNVVIPDEDLHNRFRNHLLDGDLQGTRSFRILRVPCRSPSSK